MKLQKFAFLVYVLVAAMILLLAANLLTSFTNKCQLLSNTETKETPLHVPIHLKQRRTGSYRVHREEITDDITETRTILSNNHFETEVGSENEKEGILVSSSEIRDGKVVSKASPEVTHIEFLKVHKAASTTVQNIIMRFGLKRNLSFLIPTPKNYISVEKTYFSDLWPPLPSRKHARTNVVQTNTASDESNKYDILCNHMVFNKKKVSRLLHSDSMYIAIVREPLDLFLSAAVYYKFKWRYPYLAKLSNETFITDLIRNPRQYEATTMSESMTYNSMAYDFGLNFHAGNISQNKFDAFLKDTANNFHLVMLCEKFDESLVLLRRYLNWTFEDILYTKSNTFSLKVKTNASKITKNDIIIFKKRNKFDYGLYEFFKDRLEKQIAKEILFKKEVNHFKTVLRDVQKYCMNVKAKTDHKIATMPTDKTYLENITSKDIQRTTTAKIETAEDIMRVEIDTLLEVIKSIITDTEMTGTQEAELRELAKLQSKESFKWSRSDLITMLPLLFYNKTEEHIGREGLKSDLLISESKWNKEFFVTSSDCELMTMDEPSLFGVVKKQHLKLLVRRKFGDDFSVIQAVKYILTFY